MAALDNLRGKSAVKSKYEKPGNYRPDERKSGAQKSKNLELKNK